MAIIKGATSSFCCKKGLLCVNKCVATSIVCPSASEIGKIKKFHFGQTVSDEHNQCT